jgi:hypothetical protein
VQWKSYQEVNAEVEGFYGEWQREKEDLLDSIRLLHHQMQLKNMVIDAFIPPEELQKVRRAPWGAGRELALQRTCCAPIPGGGRSGVCRRAMGCTGSCVLLLLHAVVLHRGLQAPDAMAKSAYAL